jgi:hypothetical protein
VIFTQQPPKEGLCALSITSFLEKLINHFTALINRPPKVMLLSLNLYKYLINEEGITISLMLSSQSLRKLRAELIAP